MVLKSIDILQSSSMPGPLPPLQPCKCCIDWAQANALGIWLPEFSSESFERSIFADCKEIKRILSHGGIPTIPSSNILEGELHFHLSRQKSKPELTHVMGYNGNFITLVHAIQTFYGAINFNQFTRMLRGVNFHIHPWKCNRILVINSSNSVENIWIILQTFNHLVDYILIICFAVSLAKNCFIVETSSSVLF